jgi:acyl carrier protein
MTETLLTTQAPLQAQTEMMEGIVRRFAPKNRMPGAFTSQTNLLDDVGIDSASMIDIVLEIEDRFGVTIEDDDSQGVKTFGELMDLVTSRIGEGQ